MLPCSDQRCSAKIVPCHEKIYMINCVKVVPWSRQNLSHCTHVFFLFFFRLWQLISHILDRRAKCSSLCRKVYPQLLEPWPIEGGKYHDISMIHVDGKTLNVTKKTPRQQAIDRSIAEKFLANTPFHAHHPRVAFFMRLISGIIRLYYCSTG